jgi:ankyrin repeat protein
LFEIQTYLTIRRMALYDAANAGNLKRARNLLASGADVNKTSATGITPLLIASQNGHLEVVKALLAAGADANKAKDTGATPLLIASQNGHLEVVKALLAAGADVNKASNIGLTPVHTAAQKGHLEVVKALLAAGADVNKANTYGETPLYTAAGHGRHLEIIKALLAAGADVNKAKDTGATPLFTAEQSGNLEIVKALLAAGADVNKANDTGTTPLFLAAQNGDIEILRTLLAAGADIHKANTIGAASLYKAAQRGHLEIVKILLAAGADIYEKAPYIPFEYAKEHKFIPVINRLILSYAKLNAHPKPANAPNKCYDPIMANEVDIDPANTTFYILKEDGNTAFGTCLDPDSLNEYLTRSQYQFYRCTDTVPNSALHIQRHKNIHPTPIRLLNFQQRIYVLDDEAQRLKPGKQYVCIPNEKLGRIVSEDFLEGGSAVSATHCQPEDGSMLYTLKEIVGAAGGRRRKTRQKRLHKRRKTRRRA